MKVTIRYGNEKSQYGELYLPGKNCTGTVCLLHGGFWTMPHNLNQFDDVAAELIKSGYCVWNIEYRRTGETKYKWSDPFQDTITAINELVNIKKAYNNINLDNVIVLGHSAGGQLSIWLNSQELMIDVQKFIGLSPILDLETAYYANTGNGCVERLLQGRPGEVPERYSYCSPILQSKKKNQELIIHGKNDEYIPIEWSRSYHEETRQLAIQPELIELENCGHMDFIDIKSNAFEVIKLKLKLPL